MPHLVNDFASKGALVDYSSDATFSKPQALLVTATGNVKIQTLDGDDLTIPVNAVPFVLPYAVRKVYSSGTTVTSGNIFSAQLQDQ